MADEVVQRQLRVANREGLHARPAALIVGLANRFHSRIELVKGDQRVDAKSIMDIMTLAAAEGTVLCLEVRGSDAQAAANAIEKMIVEELRDEDARPSTSEP